jgi:hypothetical protein
MVKEQEEERERLERRWGAIKGIDRAEKGGTCRKERRSI